MNTTPALLDAVKPSKGMHYGTQEFFDAVQIVKRWRASGRIYVAAPLPDKPVAPGKSGIARPFSPQTQSAALKPGVIEAALHLPEPIQPRMLRSLPGVNSTNAGNVIKKWTEMGWLVKDGDNCGQYVRTSGFGVLPPLR